VISVVIISNSLITYYKDTSLISYYQKYCNNYCSILVLQVRYISFYFRDFGGLSLRIRKNPSRATEILGRGRYELGGYGKTSTTKIDNLSQSSREEGRFIVLTL